MKYDVIVIGGGIGGSSFATVMAGWGARVLVVEREKHFRDRVRGEWISPWGVVDAKHLGIYETMVRSGGHELRYMRTGNAEPRDLRETPVGETSLGFYHPTMQEALLSAAANAGADVWRGSRARLEMHHGTATVVVERHGVAHEFHTLLVVAADGRNSAIRQQAGFDVQHGSDHLRVAGLLFDGLSARDDTVQVWRGAWSDPATGLLCLLFPQGRQRVRAYVACSPAAEYRLAGPSSIPHFVRLFTAAGAPADLFETAKPNNPLASYPGRHVWIDHPYRNSVALIGDAAAVTDPTYGLGLSMTLHDVRSLSDRLLMSDNWNDAGHAYAEEHDRYYNTIHKAESWLTEILYTVDAEAVARRPQVLAAWEKDPTRRLDLLGRGPDRILDEQARIRLFAEDALA